jgi:hypothetical protein
VFQLIQNQYFLIIFQPVIQQFAQIGNIFGLLAQDQPFDYLEQMQKEVRPEKYEHFNDHFLLTSSSLPYSGLINLGATCF